MNDAMDISSETVSLSEISEVGAGSRILFHRPNDSNPYHRSVLYYQGSSCTRALHGQMGAPLEAEVGISFDVSNDAKKLLALGDIIIPRTFGSFGCGIYDDSYDECYANRALFVIRGHDPLTHEYLSVLFRTEEGEKYVRDSAAPTKSYGMSTITLKKLRALKVPVVSEATMKSICADYQERTHSFYKDPGGIVAGGGGLEKKASFLQNKVREQNFEIAALKTALNAIIRETGQVDEKPLIDEKELISLARNVEKFLQAAINEGLVSIVNGSKVCIGKDHSVHVTKAGNAIVENMTTGGIFVYKKIGRKIDVVFVDSFDEADIHKFEVLSKIVAQDSSVEVTRAEPELGI